MTEPTQMAREIGQISQAAAALAQGPARDAIRETATHLRALNPPAVLTVARGSSDHAATYLNYAIQLTLGIPVASVGPSIASVYGQALKADGFAALAISQSGASDDIIRLAGALRDSGAHVVALTNTAGSPLSSTVQDSIDVMAGPEHAVAATKSFVNSILAGLWLIADWAEDDALATALAAAPDAFGVSGADAATQPLLEALETADRAVVIARGPVLGLAQEFALKLLETCRIHATSYSGAEVLHGPSAILTDGYPVVALRSGSGTGLDQSIDQIRTQGAYLVDIPVRPLTGHPLVDPLLNLPLLYTVAEQISRARGMDPDRPEHLKKQTKTV